MFYTKRAATLAATIATTLFLVPVTASQRMQRHLDAVQPIGTTQTVEAATDEAAVTPEPKQEERRWVGRGFNESEQRVLAFLQDRGITDRAALATILGNIRQESLFDTKICEGGRRTGYHRCYSGGFGLIQWTSIGRYNGLGTYARANGLNPNDLETQLGWMVNEPQWKSVEHIWKTPGKSINSYMNAAYRWLGWGIHGARTSYAHAYYDALYMP